MTGLKTYFLNPDKIITTISNLQTKEIYKTDEEWKAKGIDEKDFIKIISKFYKIKRNFGKV